MLMASQGSPETPQAKAPKERSPSFPFIPLSTAIGRLVALEAKFGRHPTPADKVGLAWDMKPASSQAAQTVAALKAFGLVQYDGNGPSRLTSISEDGRNYLRAQQEAVKREIAQRLALMPKMIATYWRDWGRDRPQNEVALDQLVLKANFTQSAAETFLRVYDETVAFAGLTDSVSEAGSEGELGHLDDRKPTISVGDYIQVELGGAWQFPSGGVRVRGVQSQNDKEFVFVDGEATGFPIESVTLTRKGDGGVAPPTLELPTNDQRQIRNGWREERLIDDEGGEIFISYNGEPSISRYEFIRDYLDFKINRLKK